MRRKLLWMMPLLAVALLAGPDPVRSAGEQQGTPVQAVPVTPQRVEAVDAVAPMTLLAEDARLLLEQARLRAAEAPAEPDSEADGGPPRRVIEVEPAGPVINRSDKFTFVPLAMRGDPPRAEVPMAERRAIVEQFRQQLKRQRERSRP